MNSDVRFYISIFFRRLPIFAIIALSIAAAAIVYSMRIPAKYTSDALLLIEAPAIPDELAASTVRTGPREQLEIIEQRLLTRANLLDIADELNVYPNADELFPDQIVARMRRNTVFEASTGRDRATIFNISFEASDPNTAAAVVNAYVTRVLDENVEIRTGRAEDTMEFFDAEVERLATDLAAQSQRILDFTNANINALPDTMRFRMAEQADLRTQRTRILREISDLAEERERLLLVFNATGGVGDRDLDTRSDEERDLAAAELELEEALAVLSEQHPRVRTLRARINNLERRVAAQAGRAQEEEVSPLQRRENILEIQLGDLDSRRERLEAEIVEIETELDELEQSIEATPGNGILLESLERDYASIERQYEQAVRRQSEAATGERIELLSKGERILILNQPVVPRNPSSPNRQLYSLAGIVLGLAAGAGVVMLLELLNKSIRRPVELSRSLGIVPLATLPVIRTPAETLRRRSIISFGVLSVLIGIPLILYYIHLAIMPIDLVIENLLSAFGI
ncbi:MAG: lipopolysaccharide biosynthesis [Pseudomonadota bacterium]